MELKDKMTIVQEFVPGKQITLCHIIANPGETLYTKLGLDPQTDYSRSAIGVLTIIPYEGAVIAADISMKSSGAPLKKNILHSMTRRAVELPKARSLLSNRA